MRVIITKTYTDKLFEYNNVFNIEQNFNYKLGATVTLRIEGKRNRVRIPSIDIKHMTVLD